MEKTALLWKFIQDVRASYWFFPSVMVLCGLVLAVVTGWVDRNPQVLPVRLPDSFLDTQPDSARSTLAVIAQSVIGVTGVMFSMTLVAVSFASGNFGPRLIGNFMRDRGNQLSLGILISTFVYALIVLPSVQDTLEGEVEQFVPHYSLFCAMVLTLVCVITLIYFVHHVPETINVSRISSNLGARLERQIRDRIDAQTEPVPTPWPEGEPAHLIHAAQSGYIQTLDSDQLRDLAEEHQINIEVAPAVGAFVTTATQVFSIWSDGDLSDEVMREIEECYAVGSERTENQNPQFLAEQLVEMAVRALSPGVNDPYTAMDCLNRLTAALTIATSYGGGLEPAQSQRLHRQLLHFDDLFAVTFPLCLQYVRPDDMTRDHALTLLNRLKSCARDKDQNTIQVEIDALCAEH